MKVDGECYERMELLMEQTKAEAGRSRNYRRIENFRSNELGRADE